MSPRLLVDILEGKLKISWAIFLVVRAVDNSSRSESLFVPYLILTVLGKKPYTVSFSFRVRIVMRKRLSLRHST